MVADITGPGDGVKGIGLVRRENRNGVAARTALTPCGSETPFQKEPGSWYPELVSRCWGEDVPVVTPSLL